MTTLADGTVISSAFQAMPAHTKQGSQHVKTMDNLKIATVIAVRYVDSTEGLQKSANNDSEGVDGTPYETVYDVRVDDHNVRPFIFNGCRVLRPFMGANNYFEMIHEAAENSPSYTENGAPGSPVGGIFASGAESLVGSRCVILCIEGAATAPVIMGFLQHPGRTSKIKKEQGIHLGFEFQGVDISIDKDGAFKMIGNGPWQDIIAPITGPIPESSLRKDAAVGPFTIELTKDMQFSIMDNENQKIALDRVAKTITITNGNDKFIITKGDSGASKADFTVDGTLTITTKTSVFKFEKSLDLDAPEIKIAAKTKIDATFGQATFKVDKKFDLSAQEVMIAGQTSFSVETGKVKIKGSTGELLTIIAALIDAIGTLAANSPVGPCAPLTAAPSWAQVMAELQKLKGMTG